MVEIESSIPLACILFTLPVERLVIGVFLDQHHGQEARPHEPLGIAWKGAGGWLIVSQSRQLSFSRTCSVTNHWRGITSRVSVTSSPTLERLLPPQHEHDVGVG